MKLNTLKLRNFKGIRDFEINPNGQDISIWGDNATGKTTLVDAFLWLLFDKDSANRKDFEIKTLGDDGQSIHGLEHEVTAVLDVGGKQATLRKVYAERWTKKRGSTSKVFTGHETTYFIDEVPVKQNDYKVRIGKLIDEDTCKLLTNPRYFPEVLKWQDRRATLLEVCGDVSDTDVIASDTSLAKLPGILGGRSLDDHKEAIKSRRSTINKELADIPVRIDEAQRSIVTVNQSPAVITSELTELKEQRQAKEQEIVQLQAGGGIAEKQVAIGEIDAALDQIKRDYEGDIADQVQAARDELRSIMDELEVFDSDVKIRHKKIAEENEAIDGLEERMVMLRQEWNAIDSSPLEDICDYCGQALPEDKMADANRHRAERLEAISNMGKTHKENIGERDRTILMLNGELAELIMKGGEIKARVEAAEKQKVGLGLHKNAYEATKIWRDPTVKKETILQEIEQLKTGNTDAIQAARWDIATSDQAIGGLERVLAQINQSEETQKRIEELKDQEKTLGKEFEKLESELYLTEQFVRSKVQLLEGKINSRFQLTRFKMFEEQINEGIRECCEALGQDKDTKAWVPYTTNLNGGGRANVGLDCINTLSEHYKFNAPIFFDNAEAVTRLIPTTGQQIRLYVSEPDKILRVESEASND